MVVVCLTNRLQVYSHDRLLFTIIMTVFIQTDTEPEAHVVLMGCCFPLDKPGRISGFPAHLRSC